MILLISTLLKYWTTIDQQRRIRIDLNKRKRSLVVIVAHRTCTTEIFHHLPDLFDAEKASSLKFKFSSQDILATRNSILLYKALK